MPGDKTEQPTDKRLRDLREQGQVCKSQEIASTAVVLAVFAYVGLGYDWIRGEIEGLALDAAGCVGQPFEAALKRMSLRSLRAFAWLSLPAAAAAALAGAVGHLAQTGPLFAFKAAAPRLDRLHPKQWFEKTFSVRNLFEFGRSVLKMAVVALVFHRVFREALPLLLRLPGQGTRGVDLALRQILWRAAAYCAAAFAGIAAVDWLFQRRQYLKQHRMSKEDVKNEFKQMEGDPLVKGQRRQLHQEMAMNDAAQAVRRADVLVTNPTHLAIALEYQPDRTPLPVVLAKGEGALAARMVKAAEEAGVPILRDVPLAHGLWDEAEELRYIPSSLIEPVAEVLRWLREMKEAGGTP